jgi:hypothetical protein
MEEVSPAIYLPQVQGAAGVDVSGGGPAWGRPSFGVGDATASRRRLAGRFGRRIALSEHGERHATDVIRRHRLIEAFLAGRWHALG